MKRIIILMSVTTLLLGTLYGCGSKNSENNDTKSDTNTKIVESTDNGDNISNNSNAKKSASKEKYNAKKATDNVSNRIESSIEKGSETENNNKNSHNTDNYGISEETYSNGNIKITYPQIKNLNDSKKQDSLNTILKNQALAATNYYDISNLNAVLKVSYDIQFQDNNNLSILYKGDFNSGSSVYPVSVIYTSNIDIKDGKSIRLKDYADTNDLFNKLRKSNSDSNIASTKNLADAQTEYLSNIDDGTLKTMLLNADFSESNGNIQFPEIFSYKKNNNIIISIPVPHAIGDYAEFILNNE